MVNIPHHYLDGVCKIESKTSMVEDKGKTKELQVKEILSILHETGINVNFLNS